jgi:hypothetical protein
MTPVPPVSTLDNAPGEARTAMIKAIASQVDLDLSALG